MAKQRRPKRKRTKLQQDKAITIPASNPTTLSSVFDRLNDDTLRAVLIRCNLDDVPNLHRTCSRFNAVMKTPTYRRDRARINNAVVTAVKIMDPFEQYKTDDDNAHKLISETGDESVLDPSVVFSRDDASFVRRYNQFGGQTGEYEGMDCCSRFQVFVDHTEIKMENLNIYLIPRGSNANHLFFDMCDSIDPAMEEISLVCFNGKGNPRLRSLIDAIPRHDKRPLLYISGT